MKSAIIKRSVVLDGHKTSVSLENEFWEGLREIAEAQKTNLSNLVRQVDRDRNGGNLSSAIRVYVFKHFRGDYAAATEAADKNRASATWPMEPVDAH